VIPSSPTPFEHAQHEKTLVLRYFEDDPDLTREERLLASALIRTCQWCAALGSEAKLIADANRAMFVPPAGRDFRITPAQARGSRAIDLGSIGSRFRQALTTELVRPLAGAAVAVGLVIAVISAVPYLNNPGSSSGNNAETGPANASASTAYGPEHATGTPEVNAADSTFPGPMVATGPHADATPATGDTSAESSPPLGASSLRMTFGESPSPSEPPEIAAASGPGASPPAVNNAAGNGGALSAQPKSNEAGASEPLPPLLIFGVLIAIVGLLVLVLTVLARRMEPSQH
jgi:hypothetical protein